MQVVKSTCECRIIIINGKKYGINFAFKSRRWYWQEMKETVSLVCHKNCYFVACNESTNQKRMWMNWLDNLKWKEPFCERSNMWMCISETGWLWTFLMAFSRMSDMIDCCDYSPYLWWHFRWLITSLIEPARMPSMNTLKLYPFVLWRRLPKTFVSAINSSSSSSSHKKKIEPRKCKALFQENSSACLMLFHFPGGRFLYLGRAARIHNFIKWNETWIYCSFASTRAPAHALSHTFLLCCLSQKIMLIEKSSARSRRKQMLAAAYRGCGVSTCQSQSAVSSKCL